MSMLKSAWSNDLFRNTTIFYIGSMLVNFGSLLFHIQVARLLGPVEYGILGSLIGLTYFASVPISAIDLVMTKIISSFSNDKFIMLSRGFVSFVMDKFLRLSYVVIPILILLSWPIKSYLHLAHIWGIILVWLTIYLSTLIAIFTPILKARLQYGQIITYQSVGAFLRLVLGFFLILFVSRSFLGAQMALVLSSIASLLILVYQLRFLVYSPQITFNHHDYHLKSLGINGLLLTGAFTAMYSLDAVLVKHYLPDHWTGVYAVLATAGKIIFFASSPIGIVALPIISRKSSRPHLAKPDFLLTLGLVTLIGVFTIVAYFFFPEIIIDTIFTAKFSDAVPYLPWIGLAMFFYSTAAIFSNLLLALGQTKVSYIALFGLISEIILIGIFHQSVGQVIASLTAVFGILLFIILTCFLYATQKNRSPAVSGSSSL